MFEEYIYEFADKIDLIPVIWIFVIAFMLTFTENIFPPAPCDAPIVILGTMIGLGKINFIPLLLVTTAGSVLGFYVMFLLGSVSGKKIIDSNKFKFINSNSLNKPRRWFNKYGYYLIVANRFLSGTRAVISFFAGVSKLSAPKTLILSALSALVWNGILIYLGNIAGRNWENVWMYMKSYGRTTLLILAALILAFIAFKLAVYFKNKHESKNSG